MTKKIQRIVVVLLTAMFLFTVTACSTTTSTTDTSDTATAESISDLTDITIHEAAVTLSDADWQAVLDDPTAETFYEASITYDGTTLDDVAFRTKGNSTLTSVASSDSERYSFKIKTDKYTDDQLLNGTNEFVLNNMYADPSYLREYITYNASDYLGLVTPDTEFVELTVNGEDYGLYLYVESYDDTFVEDNTDSDDTQLYKADGENCTLKTADGTTGFELEYGDDEDLTKIQTLIDTLDAASADNMTELESLLDVDSVLKWTALSYTLGNYDSYIGTKAHNYDLLYTDGKFEMLGWDYNMSFGGFAEDQGSSLSVSAEDLYLGTTAEDRPLVSKLLEVDEYKTQYLAYVDQLETWLADYDTALPAMADAISSNVENDPTAFYTSDQFWSNINGTDMTIDDVSSVSGMTGSAQPGIDDAAAAGGVPSDSAAAAGGVPSDSTAAAGGPPAMDDSAAAGGVPAMDDSAAAAGDLPAMGGQMQGQNGGMSISQDTISINDYIRLRLEN